MEILFFYLLLLLNFVKSIEFKKNSDILNTPKSADPKVKEILEIQDILNHISQSKHFIIVFHADWCYHWYSQFNIANNSFPHFMRQVNINYLINSNFFLLIVKIEMYAITLK